MYSKLLKIIGYVLYKSGIFYVFTVLAKGRVVSLVYHNPTWHSVSEHIAFYSKYGNFVKASRDHYLDYSTTSDQKLNFLLTFDDGYSSYLDLVENLALKGIYPHLFINTITIDSNRRHWWEVVTSKKELLSLKSVPNKNKLEHLKEHYDWTSYREYGSGKGLESEAIKYLDEHSVVGAHTHTHPILSMCSQSEMEDEINLNKLILEKLIGRKMHVFAYPNGQNEDYGPREIEVLKEQGIKFARTTHWGVSRINKVTINPYRIPGIIVIDNCSIDEAVARIMGVDYLLRSMHNTYKRVKGLVRLH